MKKEAVENGNSINKFILPMAYFNHVLPKRIVRVWLINRKIIRYFDFELYEKMKILFNVMELWP